MITLRPYQAKAVDDIAKGLTKHKRVIGWFPTASGKSLLIAETCRRILEKHPGNRVLVLCHTAEILAQNNQKTRLMGLDSGIYCAGLKRKDTNNRVIHASRDSIKGHECGFFEFCIIDEAHTLSESETTRYRKLLELVAPKYVIGLTGTPWRMKGGRIFGKDNFWEACVASIPMQTLFEQGYLSPYVVPAPVDIIGADGIKSTGGDFNLQALDEKSTPGEVIKACLDQWEHYAKGRKFTLIFCCSIAHAQKVHVDLLKRGYRGTYLTEKTTAMDRKRILAEVKDGQHEYLCNVAVLTTGVDIPITDCVLFLRATQSLSLWIQMIGRGLRLSEGKENCIMIDCAGNFERLGKPERPKEPMERKASADPKSWTPEELEAMGIDPEMMVGSAGEKKCPNCSSMMPIAARKCRACGHLFINHTHRVYHGEIKPGVYDIEEVNFRHVKKKDQTSIWIAEYTLEKGIITEFLGISENVPDFAREQNKAKIQSLSGGIGPTRAEFTQSSKGYWRTKWKETRKLSSLDGSELRGYFAGETTQQGSTTKKLIDLEACRVPDPCSGCLTYLACSLTGCSLASKSKALKE